MNILKKLRQNWEDFNSTNNQMNLKLCLLIENLACLQMEQFIWDNGHKMDKSTVEACKFGLMVQYMKVTGLMIMLMGTEELF